MLKLIFMLMRRKKRKYIIVLSGIITCALFISVMELVYSGHISSIIENAYLNVGKWDISVMVDNVTSDPEELTNERLLKVASCDVTYSVRQGKIPEDYVPDSMKDTFEYYYMSLVGIHDENDVVLVSGLWKGRWPESDNEIVVPKDFILDDGRSVAKESIKIGDKITIPYGIRKDENGKCSQDEIAGKESFILSGAKEYTICGIFDYEKKMSTQHVSYGYCIYDKEQKESEYYCQKSYYCLCDENYEDLVNIYGILEDSGEYKEVKINQYVENALKSIELTDYLRTLKNGIFVLEFVLIVSGVCVIVICQYQNLHEEQKQMKLMFCVGAKREQIYQIYLTINFIVLVLGYGIAFCILIVFSHFWGKMVTYVSDSTYFDTGLQNINVTLFLISFFIMTLSSLIVLFLVIKHKLPKHESMGKRNTYRYNQKTLSSLYNLAECNNHRFSGRRVIKTFVVILALTVIPCCCIIGISSYQIAERDIIKPGYDFMLSKDGDIYIESEYELESIPEIESIQKKAGVSATRMILSEEMLGKEVFDDIKAKGWYDSYIDGSGNLIWSVPIVFPEENYYRYMQENGGSYLPDYETFSSEKKSIVQGYYHSFDSKKYFDVGKTIIKNTGVMCGSSFTNLENSFELEVGYSWVNIATEKSSFDTGLTIVIIAPIELYYKYFNSEDFHHETLYKIIEKKGTYEILYRKLNDFAFLNGMYISDIHEYNKEAQETFDIRVVSVLICVTVVIIVAVILLYVVNKLDRIIWLPSIKTYRNIGIDKKTLLKLSLLENSQCIVDALIVGIVMHIIASLSFMRNVYSFYNITLKEMGIAMFVTLGVVIILTVAFSVIHAFDLRKQADIV
ncbi:MAG: ABC transporter permease [Lachnospiraceae bacterium]|nr:ABC transporter permease [Lachnospiraceae bacterium]